MTEPINAETGANTTDAGNTQQNTAANGVETTTPASTVKTEQKTEAKSEETTSLTDGAKPEQAKDDAAAQDDKAKDSIPEGAPEKYEFVSPENVILNDDVMGKFSETAKELNLTQEAAQKLIDAVAPVMAEKQLEVLKQARADWKEQSEHDKEIGGDKFAANLATARKALDSFGSPELVSLLNQSGLGEHPEVIRFFYRAGKSISEDRIVPGGVASEPTSRDPAMVLYGKPTN